MGRVYGYPPLRKLGQDGRLHLNIRILCGCSACGLQTKSPCLYFVKTEVGFSLCQSYPTVRMCKELS
jgi:hypothetical protein